VRPLAQTALAIVITSRLSANAKWNWSERQASAILMGREGWEMRPRNVHYTDNLQSTMRGAEQCSWRPRSTETVVGVTIPTLWARQLVQYHEGPQESSFNSRLHRFKSPLKATYEIYIRIRDRYRATAMVQWTNKSSIVSVSTYVNVCYPA